MIHELPLYVLQQGYVSIDIVSIKYLIRVTL